jgi:hypothetical protein
MNYDEKEGCWVAEPEDVTTGCSALVILVLLVAIAFLGPKFCAYDARVRAENRAEWQKQVAWKNKCVARGGKVLHFSKASITSACLIDGKMEPR